MNKTGKSIQHIVFTGTKSSEEHFKQFLKLNKLNRALLDQCPGIHNFSIELSGKIPSQTRWECSICGGEIDSTAKFWYEKGVKHGQLHNPN